MIKSFQLILKNFFSDFTSNRRLTCEDKYHSYFNDKTNKKIPRKSKYTAEMPKLAKNYLNELMRTNSDLNKLLSYNKSLNIYILDEPKTYYSTYWLILKFIIYAETLIYPTLSDGKFA